MILTVYQYECDNKLKYILYSGIIVLFLLVSQTNSIEGMTDLEAVSNVASLYNNQNMTVSNLNVTGKLTVNGLSKLSGIDNRNGITNDNLNMTGSLTVNGLSNLSGIDNRNGITNDNLNMTGKLNLTDTRNFSISMDGGKISFKNGVDQSIQTISNNYNGFAVNNNSDPSLGWRRMI